MAGARSVVVDDALVVAALRRLKDAGRNLRPFFLEVGEEMVESTQARFETQTDPDGVPWHRLSDRYRDSRRKRTSKGAKKILTLHGVLGTTIAAQPADDSVAWGTNREYGARMQFGYDDGPHVTPARRFLGVSSTDRKVILDIAQEHFLGGN